MSAANAVNVCDWRGLPAWQLRAEDGSRAIVLERGAQLVSWCTADGVERLYASPNANLLPGAAIRGGVPVCFPQFAGRGSLPQHGIVRTRDWRCAPAAQAPGLLQCELEDDDSTRALWSYRFHLQLEIALQPNRIDLSLTARNTGDTVWSFMAALHTYLATNDLTACRLQGLPAGRVFDNIQQAESPFPGAVLSLAQPLDQVHGGISESLYLHGAVPSTTNGGAMEIRQRGFSDAVVWNPGAERARAIADLPDKDWRRFICVEAAQINQPVSLAPGAIWCGEQSLVWHPSES
jgi:glucose-6-phosphate 1-epimerase